MHTPRILRRVAAAILLASALADAGCAKKAAPPAPPPPAVTTVTAENGVVQPNERLAGVIAPFQNVAIQSTLTEPADEVYVQEGDVVRKGEVLARLDTADLEAALAADLASAQSAGANTTKTVYQSGLNVAQGVDSLRTAQAALRQAQANLARDTLDLNRYHQLVTQGYISAQQFQQQQTTVSNDQAGVRSAEATVASAQSNVTANGSLQTNGLQSASVAAAQAATAQALAQADQERVEIAKAAIVSPIDGVVVNRNLNPGEYPGSRQLFTLQQVDPIFAVLHGSSSEIAHIATGATVAVNSSDLHRTYAGTVVGVLNQITPGSTDFEVKVRLPNQSGRLRSGMPVAGMVSLPPLRGIKIPTTAFTDDTHAAVMVVHDDDTVHTAAIAEVGGDGKNSIVTGLPSGARVVANGQAGVGEGQKVAAR